MNAAAAHESTTTLELETTLCYVLPVDVAQGAFFDAFWQLCCGYEKRMTNMESFTYRLTRYGTSKWRVGERREILPSDVALDRLAVLRHLVSTTSTAEQFTTTIVSELKFWLTIDRCFIYDDSISLLDNARYPLIMEDRLSVEVKPYAELMRHLLDVEDDTSDNNLGIRFVHRLSSVDKKTGVRVAMRATLNEFHEISYTLELEREQLGTSALDNVQARRTRHTAIMTTLRDLVLPNLLQSYWPQGLRLDAPSQELPVEILDDCDSSGLRAVRTGRSLLTVDALHEYLTQRANEITSSSSQQFDDNVIWAKLKYDGHRAYGVYAAPGQLRVNGRIIPIGLGTIATGDIGTTMMTDDDLSFSGLFVYQVEILNGTTTAAATVSSSKQQQPVKAVITEVAYAWDHMVLIESNGGGALRRQIEHANSGGVLSHEQRDPITSFLLHPTMLTIKDKHPWYRLASVMEQNGATLCAVDRFLETSSQCYGSYVWPNESSGPVTTTTTSCGGGGDGDACGVNVVDLLTTLKRARVSMTGRRLYDNWCVRYTHDVQNAHYHCLKHFLAADHEATAAQVKNADSGIDDVSMVLDDDAAVGLDWRNFTVQKRALMNLRPTVSKCILQRMLENRCTVTATVCISRPYDLHTDMIELMQAFHRNSHICDGIMLSRRRPQQSLNGRAPPTDADFVCEKVKLRQTTELALSWDRNVMFTSDNTIFAVRQVDRSRNILRGNYHHHDASQLSMPGRIWRIDNGDGDNSELVEIIDLPTLSLVDDNNTMRYNCVVELEYCGPGTLRFVRWRVDKDIPDSAGKALAVIHNR